MKKINLNYTTHHAGEWITVGDFIDDHMETGAFLMVDAQMVIIRSINAKTSDGSIFMDTRRIIGGTIGGDDLELSDKTYGFYRHRQSVGVIYIPRKEIS